MPTIDAFNRQLIGLAKSLYEIIPNDDTIEKAYKNLEWFIEISPEMPINLFKSKVYDEYRTKILEKDETFFLSFHGDSFNEDISAYTSVDKNDIINLIKTYWNSFSEEQKEIIWKMVRNLIKLCDKYCEENR